MKIRLIAIALTMLMIISGFAVLVSYAPANNSNPVSPSAIGSNETALYEYSIYNNGSSATSMSEFIPFEFNDENLFIFNTTDNMVQNVLFLYPNGSQIKTYIPNGDLGLKTTDLGSGNWSVYFFNMSIPAKSYQDVYMQVFPSTMSVLNANESTTSYSYIQSGMQPFDNPNAWDITGSQDSVSGHNLTVSTSSSVSTGSATFTYIGSLPTNSVITATGWVNWTFSNNDYLGNGGSVSYTSYATVGSYISGSTFNGAGLTSTVSGSSTTPYTSSGNAYVANNGTSTTTHAYSFSGTGSNTFSTNFTLKFFTPKVSNINVSAYTSTTYNVYLNVIGGYMSVEDPTYPTNSNVTETVALMSPHVFVIPTVANVTQKNIGTVTTITPTSSNTGNYVLFNETGLPYGQSWNVALTNKTANVVNSVYASTTNTAKAFLPSGYNYSFSFSTFDKSYYKIVNLTGNVYLSSQANATVNITLTNVSYDVVFHESGLLSGNAWGIKFNGTDDNTTSTSLTFIEKNGSYPFTVIISKLYNSNVSSGYANISGKSVNLYIGFTYHAFNITFSEVGLPSDVQWSMTINGTVYYSNVSDSNILLFQAKAGSYDGIVNNASYYIPVTKYFNFTISGNAQYTIDYGIILTFIESGYNGLWHITINGVTYSSSTNTIVATVSPGQVVFNVWGISGYTINPEVVTQSYTSAQTIRVAFTVQPASFENVLISTPMIILYFILAIMTMAGVVYWRLKHER